MTAVAKTVASLAFSLLASTTASALSCMPAKGSYVVVAGAVRYETPDSGQQGGERVTRPVVGADAATFAPIPVQSQSPCARLYMPYGRDARRVYFEGVFIEGADSASFQDLGGGYARDSQAVYGKRRKLTERAAQFRLLEAGYATDGENYFFGEVVIEDHGFELLAYGYARTRDRVFHNGVVLAGADPRTFAMVPNGYGYARSADSVYRHGVKLAGMDAATFEIKWPANSTSRDKDRVYYQDRPIRGADPATFEQISSYLYRDRRAVYLEGKEIVGADPLTARHSRLRSYVIDAKSVYYQGGRLERDVATFEELQPFYSRDKNGVYHQNRPMEDVDLATFKATSLERAEDKNYRYQGGQPACVFNAARSATLPACAR